MEFGEKLKRIREEKGMTQQTLADQLYVTRQAVSRWECGARYPDILTAKKIAEALNVSMDELVSGEELKRNVEKEPVLATPTANVVQTILYTIGMVTYGLMCLFTVYSFLQKPSLAGTPAGKISILEIGSALRYVLNFAVLLYGTIESARNRLSPKRVGVLMSTSFAIEIVNFFIQILELVIKKNGYMDWTGWLSPLANLIAIVVILWYFGVKKRVTPIPVYLVVAWRLAELLYAIKISTLDWSDIAFVVRSVRYVGVFGLVVLLAYQAYVLDKKRRVAVDF